MDTPRFCPLLIPTLLLTAVAACADPGPQPVHLATAYQMGPVGYRDPAGAVSPDGRWLAHSQGREVIAIRLADGERRRLGVAPSQVRYLVWHPSGEQLLVHERSFDRRRQDWFLYHVETGAKEPLWGGDRSIREGLPASSELLELAWAPDGQWLAGITRGAARSRVWRIMAAGDSGAVVAEGDRLSLPVVGPEGEIACIERTGGVQSLRLPCSSPPVDWLEGHQPYGHVAFSPDGRRLHYAAPRTDGALELWTRTVGGGPATLLASGARDSYGPGVTQSGAVVYRSQRYEVFLSRIPAGGGEPRQVTAFQSETPTWNPAGTSLSFTFGGWRLATDDVNYPDIDQHIGIVHLDRGSLPKSAPDRVVRQSWSEDQGMHWSPNGRWIAYHSHLEGTDDIFLIPESGSPSGTDRQPGSDPNPLPGSASGTASNPRSGSDPRPGSNPEGASAPGDQPFPRMISRDGHETGWPRWSLDGRWIAFPSYTRAPDGARTSRLYIVPVDQETGRTGPQLEVALNNFPHDALQAEWTADSEALVFEAAEGAGRKALYRVAREGGEPVRIHAWESDQVHSGIAVSPDGQWAVYIGPGREGFFQLHRVPLTGEGAAEQLTFDRSQKTQPAWDPTGEWIAYTVFRYEARFMQIEG